MAITYVGGQVGGVAGGTGNISRGTTTTYSLTGGSGASPANGGDVIIIALVVAATAVPARWDIGDGFRTLCDIQTGTVTNKVRLVVGFKVAMNNGEGLWRRPPNGNAAHAMAYAIHVWRGVDIMALELAAATASGTATGQPNPPSATPATAGSIIIAAGAASAATGANFTSSDLSNFITTTQADTYDAMVGMGSYAWTSGTFDPAVWGGGTTGASDSWAAATFALRPAIAAGSQIVIDEAASTGFTFSTVNISGRDYRIAVAAADATLVVTRGGDAKDFLVGGGGSGGLSRAGGGGAGGVHWNDNGGAVPVPAGTYNVIVGTGGVAPTTGSTPGTKGEDTEFGLITASGGGGGAAQVSNGAQYGGDGGSGGGGSGGDGTTTTTNLGGLASGMQGTTGGSGFMVSTGTLRAGGGGGGWGGAGGNAASGVGGAAGIASSTSFRGTVEYFAPGGAGASDTGYGTAPPNGAGTPGAGGNGGHTTGVNPATDGVAGIIILKYPAIAYLSGSPLVPPTLSATAQAKVKGEAAILVPPTLSGAAQAKVKGEAAILVPPTLSGAAQAKVAAQGAILVPPTLSGAAQAKVQGEASILVPPFVTGTVEASLAAAALSGALLIPPILSATAKAYAKTSGNLLIPPTLSATAKAIVDVQGSLLIPPIVSGELGPGIAEIEGSILVPPMVTSTAKAKVKAAAVLLIPPLLVGSIVRRGAALAPGETDRRDRQMRQRYPAIPTDAVTETNIGALIRVVKALRERVEIFSRDRGRIEDSFVRVEDLIELGLIKPEDLEKLSRR